MSSISNRDGGFRSFFSKNLSSKRKVSRYEQIVCGLACFCRIRRLVKKLWRRGARLGAAVIPLPPSGCSACWLLTASVRGIHSDTNRCTPQRHDQGTSPGLEGGAQHQLLCGTSR